MWVVCFKSGVIEVFSFVISHICCRTLLDCNTMSFDLTAVSSTFLEMSSLFFVLFVFSSSLFFVLKHSKLCYRKVLRECFRCAFVLTKGFILLPAFITLWGSCLFCWQKPFPDRPTNNCYNADAVVGTSNKLLTVCWNKWNELRRRSSLLFCFQWGSLSETNSLGGAECLRVVKVTHLRAGLKETVFYWEKQKLSCWSVAWNNFQLIDTNFLLKFNDN